MTSRLTQPVGARFDMRPQGYQQLVHAPQQLLVRVTDGEGAFVLRWTRDGFDALRVCEAHSWASVERPATDKRNCEHCPACDFHDWLISAERERALNRFRDVLTLRPTTVRLGPQGHGH